MLEQLKQNFHHHESIDRNVHESPSSNFEHLNSSEPQINETQPVATQFSKTLQQTTVMHQLQQGHCCFEQGQFDAAIVHYRRALSTDPTRADIYQYLAETLSKVGKLSEAAACYRQAIELATPPESEIMQSTTNLQSQQAHANTSHSSSEHADCLPIELSREQVVDGTDSDACNSRRSGNKRSKNKKSGTGFAKPKADGVSNGISSAVQDSTSYLTKAENYYRQGNWQEAATYCRYVLQIQPSSAACKLLGNTLQRLGQFTDAAESYLSALQLEPQSADIYANLGSLYAQQQRWQDAVVYYQKAITLKPDFAGVYRNLAKVWTQLGQSHQVADCWYRAFTLEPETASAEDRINLGNLLLMQNRMDEAIECYRDAIRLAPALAGGYQNLAEALIRQGKPQDATPYYQKAQELGLDAASISASSSPVVITSNSSSLSHSSIIYANNGAESGSEIASKIASNSDTNSRKSNDKMHALEQFKNQTNNKQLQQTTKPISLSANGKAVAADYTEPRQRSQAINLNAETLKQLEPELAQTYRHLIQSFQEKDKLVEVIRSSTEVLEQLEPELVQTCRDLAESFHAKGKLTEAISCYQRVVELTPNSAADRVNLGSLYAQQEQWQAAISCYQSAIALNKNLASAHWNLAKVWEEIDHPEQAAQSFLRALSLEPSWASLPDYLNLAHTLRSQGNRDAAITCYQQIVQRNVTCAEAHAALGEIFATRQQWQNSITHYRQAVLYRRDNLKDLIGLAQVFVSAQQWRKAVAVYRQILGRNLHPSNYLALAQCLEQLEDWNEAIECYRALTVHYSHWQIYHKLGDLLNQQQRWQEAVIAFRQAIDLNPNYSWSHNNLGDALIHLECWQAAAESFQKAIDLNPDFHWSHYNLGEALAKLEEWDGAIEAYRQAMKLQPDMPYVHQKLGDALRERSKLDQATAIQLYRRAISQSPEDLTSYHRAIEMQPQNRSLYLELADALVRQGEPNTAKVFYQIAQQLQQDPDSSYVLSENDGALKKKINLDDNSQDNCLDSFTPSFNEIESASLNTDVRLIAFYLPQFHPIPENDRWWGKGFTEWRNVTRALPWFEGHYQPHLPADLGFYDLRLPEVRKAQAELAKRYGIHGFCYYYYWFNGKRLLERPLDDMLQSDEPDFPFCICWANENWTRRWDGLESEVLIAQEYSPESMEAFAESIVPYLLDKRYIQINGNPLLLIYRIGHLPDPVKAIKTWRQVFLQAGVGEVHISGVLGFGLQDPVSFGCDSAVQFPPNSLNHKENIVDRLESRNFSGIVYDYAEAVLGSLQEPLPSYKTFPGVMPSWDNTARRQQNGTVWINSSPENYELWLRGTIEKVLERNVGDERIVFVNAWNEWAEGAHLEPDQKHNHAFLEATQKAIFRQQDWQKILCLLQHSCISEPARIEQLLIDFEKAFSHTKESVEVIQNTLKKRTIYVEKIDKVEILSTASDNTELIYHLESPNIGNSINGDSVSISGWIVSKHSAPMAIEIVCKDTLLKQIPINSRRDDVAKAFVDSQGSSNEFSGQFSLDHDFCFAASNSVQISLRVIYTNSSVQEFVVLSIQQQQNSLLDKYKSIPELSQKSVEIISKLQGFVGQKPKLFILHDIAAAGAQLFLVRFLEWMTIQQSSVAVEILVNISRERIFQYGEQGEFVLRRLEECGAVYFIDSQTNLPENIDAIRSGNYSLLYVNTCTLGELLVSIGEIKTPVIVHVHELSFWIKHRLGLDKFRLLLNYQPHIIAVSEAVRNSLIDVCQVPSEQIELIHAFIPSANLTQKRGKSRSDIRAELGIDEDTYVLAGCGTLDWRKGSDLVLLLMVRLRKKMPASKFVCLWVGSWIDKTSEQEMKHAIEKADLSSQIILTGYKANPIDFIGAADVFILPSREDPFPLVMLEAGFRNLPVIGFDGSGGVTEFVGSDAGFVVPYLDVDAMAEKLAVLYSNSDLRVEMGHNAYRKVTELYCEEVLAPRIFNAIERVSGNSTCSPESLS